MPTYNGLRHASQFLVHQSECMLIKVSWDGDCTRSVPRALLHAMSLDKCVDFRSSTGNLPLTVMHVSHVTLLL